MGSCEVRDLLEDRFHDVCCQCPLTAATSNHGEGTQVYVTHTVARCVPHVAPKHVLGHPPKLTERLILVPLDELQPCKEPVAVADISRADDVRLTAQKTVWARSCE